MVESLNSTFEMSLTPLIVHANHHSLAEPNTVTFTPDRDPPADWVGAAVGAVVGFVVGAEVGVVVGAVVGFVVGAVVGFAVGAEVGVEPVP